MVESKPMRPSEVRVRMLKEHDELRALFCAIDALADAVALDFAPLRERIRDLERSMHEHGVSQETLLVPALKATDTWGPARFLALRHSHADRCEALTELARDAMSNELDPPSIASRARTLTLLLRRDLDEEESSLLLPEILQDDVVSLDQSDG